jgi:hypothetical protein
MKFRFTITGTYEISDIDLKKVFGTTNPQKCAKIDQDNYEECVDDLLSSYPFTVTITPES